VQVKSKDLKMKVNSKSWGRSVIMVQSILMISGEEVNFKLTNTIGSLLYVLNMSG